MDKQNNPLPLIGIGVLLFNEKNQIILLKRIGSHGAYSWAPPGGHLEFGETLEECAIREVKEELGVTIVNPKFFCITNDIFKEDNKHYISIFMKALCHEIKAIKNCEPHKTLEYRWFDLHNLPDNLFLPFEQVISNQTYGNTSLLS